MSKFNVIKAKYIALGVSDENIEYAINAVKEGRNREHLTEGLMEDYRGVHFTIATDMVDDLYKISGNEFRKQNISGFVLGLLGLAIGLGCCYYLYTVFKEGGVIVRPALVILAAVVGTIGGAISLIMAIAGKHKEDPAYKTMLDD